MKNRNCEECGNIFSFLRETAKFCSVRCKQSAYRRSRQCETSSRSIQPLSEHLYYSDRMTTLYQGDCADILPLLNAKPDLIITSPPYDELRKYGGHDWDFGRVAGTLISTMPEGGVLIWIVSDATVDYSETGTSFRQALGFMERGLIVARHDDIRVLKYYGLER